MRTTLVLGVFLMLAMSPISAIAETKPISQPASMQSTQSSSSAAGKPESPFAGDAVVAIVKEVNDEKATFGNPPRVKLEIVEVLRGDPKIDRTHAIWQPPDHGMDSFVEENPLYKEWAKKPMKGPKVGEKYILWGWVYIEKDTPVFLAGNGGRFAFSDEKRQWAIQRIHRDQELLLEYQKKREAEKQAHLNAVKKWRETVTSDDIKQYAATAEFVGIGKLSSETTGVSERMYVDFQITEILKGQQKKEFTDGAYYVTFVVPETKMSGLLERDTRYVVFLNSTAKMLNAAGTNYVTIPSGDGVVIADEQTMKALAGFVSRKPTTASMPVTSQPEKPTKAITGTLE